MDQNLLFEPLDWARKSLSTEDFTTSSSHLLKADFRRSATTLFLISGVIEFDFDRAKWSSMGSNRALPRRKIGAGLDVSVEGNKDANDAKLRALDGVGGACDRFLDETGDDGEDDVG